MIIYSRTNILLPEWILKQEKDLTEQKFLKVVQEYLARYKNYEFIKISGCFAECDRIDDIEEKRRKKW